MNLLGSAAYDPAAAVSKATSALLALTAVDTTNLRLAITVPAHGKVLFRLRCALTGATTLPAILLGVLNGATVLKRGVPQVFTGTQSAATQNAKAVAEFVVTGLTPGAMNVDAAYAVQVIVAATNIKYGGPNDTTGADAWGAFEFEAWDPQPIPTVAPGASGGLLIAGANAATTFATLTSTGAFSVNGVTDVPQTGDNFARLGAPVGASHSADVAAVKTDTAAIKVQTDKLTFTVANQIDSNVLDWKSATAPAMTGDSFARLGAPAGASVSVDVAAVKTDTAAVKVQTDKMAFTVANQIDSNVLDWKSATAPAMTGDAFARLGAAGAGLTALGDTRIANLDTTVSSRSTFAGGAVASVTAAVTVGTNNDKTGYALSTAGVQAIWDALTSALTTVGSVGKLISTNLDALISSRSTYAGGAVASVTGAVGSVTAAVTVGTNNDKTGYALSAAGVQAVWDALTSALTTVGSVGKLIATNLDALISSRMATFTQPTGFLAATFPATVASPTNISAGTITNLTNAPTAGDFTAAMKTSLNAATPAVTVSDKTGFSLTQSFPANFSSLGISVGGHILLVDTLTTYTGNTVQTGDAFARIGLAGVGLTNIGDTRVAHLDADVSSRLPTSSYTAPDNSDVVSIKATLGVAGAGLTALGDTRLAHLDADVSSRLPTSSYAAPPSAATIAGNVWDIVLSGHLTSGTTGSALNAAGAAGDPWTTALPGVYGAGTAGNIVGNNLNASITSRLATSGYTAPDNSDVVSIKATLGIAGAGLTALGDTRLAHLDADVSTRLAASSYAAPDNAGIALIKARTDNLPPDPADASDIAALFGAVSSAIAGLNNLSAAGVRTAIGLAVANLDTQLAALPTNAGITAALASADDATLAAIAALSASVPTKVAIATEVATRTLNANVKQINSIVIKGDGAATPWGPV